MELFNPKSVIDIGCGIGTWLSVFKENNVLEFIGVDGGYVDKSKLMIPLDRFISADLRLPFRYPKRFDLAISLEVAEHLPSESSEPFVDTLVNLSDVILFSAAVPGQGGQNHINEQWVNYWQEKFSRRGYIFYDDLRPVIWWNSNIEWWYKQNIFLVINEKFQYHKNANNNVLPAIHPEMHNHYKKMYEDRIAKFIRMENEYKTLISGRGGIKRSLGIFLRTILKLISNNRSI